jgi:hypothetical protein
MIDEVLTHVFSFVLSLFYPTFLRTVNEVERETETVAPFLARIRIRGIT